MAAPKEVEVGTSFTPKFDPHGLIPVIAQDVQTHQVLMVAFMNDEALAETLKTGRAVYYSRSRKKLWAKGEESGHVQQVQEILVDCDQDCLILKVKVDSGQCHVGYQSCFYRKVKSGSDSELEFVAEPVYDPEQVYTK
jgi:phosphoribosyl-AMP cyclohydrolase